jgi:hypothetical protein
LKHNHQPPYCSDQKKKEQYCADKLHIVQHAKLIRQVNTSLRPTQIVLVLFSISITAQDQQWVNFMGVIKYGDSSTHHNPGLLFLQYKAAQHSMDLWGAHMLAVCNSREQ